MAATLCSYFARYLHISHQPARTAKSCLKELRSYVSQLFLAGNASVNHLLGEGHAFRMLSLRPYCRPSSALCQKRGDALAIEGSFAPVFCILMLGRYLSHTGLVAGIFGVAVEIPSFIHVIKYASTRLDIIFLCLFRLQFFIASIHKPLIKPAHNILTLQAQISRLCLAFIAKCFF